MTVAGKIYSREINGKMQSVEAVNAFMGVFQNSVNGFWYVIDWNHKNRAAMKTVETARQWGRDADKAYTGLPRTNPEYDRFNYSMAQRGWKIVQLLGDCQVWEKRNSDMPTAHSPDTTRPSVSENVSS